LFPVFRGIPDWIKQHWRALWPLLMVFAFPNLIFMLARYFLPAQRSWISIDYLAFAFFVCWFRGKKIYVAVLMVLLFCADALGSFSFIYYFDFLTAVRYLTELPRISPWVSVPLALGLLAIAAGVAWSACVVNLKGESRNASLLLAAASILLVPIWVARGLLTESWTRQGSDVLVASTLVTEIGESMVLVAPSHPRRIESASYFAAPALAHAAGSSPQNVLIVLEESLGGLINGIDQNAVLAPLESPEIQSRYVVRRGSVAFSGGTVSGEMRELCDAVLGSGDNTQATIRSCLPWRFRQFGYHTIGIHGFTKKMFDREHWYPELGFQELIFKEELSSKLKKTCGQTFPGNCDTEIATYIGDLIAARRNQHLFIHWMTLNSHLPVDDNTASTSLFPCENFESTRLHHEICNVVKVQFEANQAIAKLVLRPDLPPMTVIISGDHAPPFLTNTLRAFYQQDKVPDIILEPKLIGGTTPQMIVHSTQVKTNGVN
jgi:hypothetical protein